MELIRLLLFWIEFLLYYYIVIYGSITFYSSLATLIGGNLFKYKYECKQGLKFELFIVYLRNVFFNLKHEVRNFVVRV